VLDGAAHSYDYPYSIAVDSCGNVVVAGMVANIYTDVFDYEDPDFTVFKLRGRDGRELWMRQINSGNGTADYAYSLALDSHDNVIVGGTMGKPADTMYWPHSFTVMKLRGSDGSSVWTMAAEGNDPYHIGYDMAKSVTVDRQDNVIACGSILDSDTWSDFAVLKLRGSDGSKLWGDYSAFSAPLAVAADRSGNVAAMGWGMNPDGYAEMKAAKWTSAGVLQWVRGAPLNNYSLEPPTDKQLAIDDAGNLYAAGSANKADYSTDLALAKWSPDGKSLRIYSLSGTDNSYEYASCVAIRNGSIPVVGGNIWNTGTGADFTIALGR
jgi:hypothetical protein